MFFCRCLLSERLLRAGRLLRLCSSFMSLCLSYPMRFFFVYGRIIVAVCCRQHTQVQEDDYRVWSLNSKFQLWYFNKKLWILNFD
jgi:hypothetical protein